jgi:protein-S-isoprenylcysteine O-methyltransferase Ste14
MRETYLVALRTLLFTVLVPGTVLVLIPYTILNGETPANRLGLGPFRYLGLAGIALGVLLYLACARQFAVAGRGTPAPYDPPKRLVVHGPYRIVRNPMYTAVLAAGFGTGIWFESPGVLSFFAIMMLVFAAVVLVYEEPSLRAKFSDEYDRYCTEVPRFLPRFAGTRRRPNSGR